MAVHVWTEAGQCWLEARLDHRQRYVIWHGGPISFAVEVKLSGHDRVHRQMVRRWGYRKVVTEEMSK